MGTLHIDNHPFPQMESSSYGTRGPAAAPKTIVLVRHGESQGQTCKSRGLNRKDPSLRDCDLTRLGQQQAKTVQQLLSCTPQLIVTSPLTRALHTTLLAFGPCSGASEWLAPVVAHPNIIERGSGIPENMPSSLSTLFRSPLSAVPGFSDIDFSLIPDGWPDFPCDVSNEATFEKGRDGRGSRQEGANNKRAKGQGQGRADTRSADFVEWLTQRPEDEIIVVCHHNTIQELLRAECGRVDNCFPIACCIGVDGELHMCNPTGVSTSKRTKTKKHQGTSAGIG